MNAEQRVKGIEPSEILQLCKDFLGNKWSTVCEDNFELTILTKGNSNRLLVCGVKDASVDNVEPKKVLVRLYGGNMLPDGGFLGLQSEAAEVLTFYCLSKYGLGPQLHGVFKGGRIEQYIPSTLLTVEQYCDDEDVGRVIARLLARFHAIEIPVNRQPREVIQGMKDSVIQYLSTKHELRPPAPRDADEAEQMAERDAFHDEAMAEIEWIEKTWPLISSRVVFAHNDASRSNILLALDDGSGCSLDQRLLLIDCETNRYNYRGSDIAKHFYSREFDTGNEVALTGRPYPSEAVRRHFVDAYLQECKKQPSLAEDWEENGRDSVDNVLKEVAFFVIVNQLVTITWMLNHLQRFWKMEEEKILDIADLGGPASWVRFYKRRKSEFLANYGQLV